MNKSFLTFFMALSMSAVAQAQEVTCTTNLPMLEMSGAVRYTSDVSEIIQWSANSISEEDFDLMPIEVVKTDFAELLTANSSIILEDAISMRDAYYETLLKNNILTPSSMLTGVAVKDVTYNESTVFPGAQFLITYELTNLDKDDKQTVTSVTFGINYVFDTCSGEGYVAGPTGVKVVKDSAGVVISDLKIVK